MKIPDNGSPISLEEVCEVSVKGYFTEFGPWAGG
jgi:hypothetical protein